ncbi:flavodoxin [Eubacterium sp.]
MQKSTKGKLYKINPKKPYTKEDINYSVDKCRANVEQQSETARPEIKGKVKKIRKYDVIFVGYPIWWGKEPKIIDTFLESYNLKGKKIVPFCTSGGSGISGSISGIKSSAKGAKIQSGKDLTDATDKAIKKWAKSKIK